MSDASPEEFITPYIRILTKYGRLYGEYKGKENKTAIKKAIAKRKRQMIQSTEHTPEIFTGYFCCRYRKKGLQPNQEVLKKMDRNRRDPENIAGIYANIP